MITFDPFWETLKKKNMTAYKLFQDYGFSHGTYDSIKHNRNVTLNTLDQLCKILHCKVEDIVQYIDDMESDESEK